MNIYSMTRKELTALIILVLLIIGSGRATPKQDFATFAPIAQAFELVSGVPASVQLAQAYCETHFGRADTLGRMYNNWFSIMDFDGDYWTGPSGYMMDAYGKYLYCWRIYDSGLHGWVDYIQFLVRHNRGHLWHDWRYWCDNPIRYGRRGYWNKIRQTILEYDLYVYDCI